MGSWPIGLQSFNENIINIAIVALIAATMHASITRNHLFRKYLNGILVKILHSTVNGTYIILNTDNL